MLGCAVVHLLLDVSVEFCINILLQHHPNLSTTQHSIYFIRSNGSACQ